jgi:hypothetical protein
MYLLCRIVACFGGNGGGDRRGVFAVGVPVKGVVLGMECYRCHCFLQDLIENELRASLICLSLRASASAKRCPPRNTRPGFIKVKCPRLGRTIPLPTLPTLAPKPVRNLFFRLTWTFLLHIFPECLHNNEGSFSKACCLLRHAMPLPSHIQYRPCSETKCHTINHVFKDGHR